LKLVFVYFLYIVVSSIASDSSIECLRSLVYEMSGYVSSDILNSAHLLIHSTNAMTAETTL